MKQEKSVSEILLQEHDELKAIQTWLERYRVRKNQCIEPIVDDETQREYGIMSLGGVASFAIARLQYFEKRIDELEGNNVGRPIGLVKPEVVQPAHGPKVDIIF